MRRSLTVSLLLSAGLRSLAFAAEPSVEIGDFRGEPFVTERMAKSYRFETDGTGQLVQELRMRIQDEAGIQQLGQAMFPYVAGRERLEIATFRVLRADGAVAAEEPARVEDLPAPVTAMFPVYSDLRILHVTAPALRVGDTLELRSVHHLESPDAPGQFWVQHAFHRQGIVLEELLEIDVPAPRAVQLRTADEHPAETTEVDGRRLYRWRHSNLARPEDTESRRDPDVELSSFASWAEVGTWYRGLQGRAAEPDSQIRDKAAEITHDLVDEEAKVRALYEFASTQYRYLALLLGASRYQPHPASEVFANGYGDCKDKHTLFAALLTAAGFEASPVLVNSRREIRPQVPAPLQFDHMITAVAVGGDLRFFDVTPQVAPFGYLQRPLRGKQGLLVPAAAEARLVDLPAAMPFPGRQAFALEGRLDDRGNLTATVQQEFRGDDEFLLRAAFFGLPAAQWPAVVERSLGAAGVSGDISDLQVSPLTATAEPLRLTYSLRKEGWADLSSLEEELRAVLPKLDLPQADDEEEPDGEPLELGGPAEFTSRLRIELPARQRAQAPVAVTLDREFARYDSSYGVEDGRLIAERRLTVVARELPPDRFDEYEAFRSAIGNDRKQTFTIASEPGASAPAGDLDADALRRAGSEALARKDYAQAIALLSRLSEATPEDSAAWYDLGRARHGAEDSEGAVTAYRRAAELEPYSEKPLAALGPLLDHLGDTAGAEQAYRRQLEIDPLDAGATAELGTILAAAGRCEQATPLLERALALDGDECEPRRSLATCLFGLDRAQEAAALLEEPGDCEALDLRGAVLSKLQRWAEAADTLTRHLENHPDDHDMRMLLALAEVQQRDLAGAIEQLEILVAQDAGYPEAQSMLGSLLFGIGKTSEAQEPLAAALEQDPNDAAAATTLGLIYAGQMRWSESLDLLERAQRLAPSAFTDQEMLDYVRGQMERERS